MIPGQTPAYSGMAVGKHVHTTLIYPLYELEAQVVTGARTTWVQGLGSATASGITCVTSSE